MIRIDRPTVTCAAYLSALAIMVIIGWTYDTLSSGLATMSFDGPFFCRNLMSSGGDDDVMVFAFVLFVLPLLIRLTRLKRSVATGEVIVF